MFTAVVQPPRFHIPIHDQHTTYLDRATLWQTLSHVESATAPPSHDALAASQHSDDELRTLLALNAALRLEEQQIPVTTVSIYCDTSAGKTLPYVPVPLRPQVFQSIHDLSLPDTKVTARLVAPRFMWQGMQKDCRTWAGACQACEGSRVSHHTVIPVGDFTLLAARFIHVHIYLVGPLLTSVGYTFSLSAVDCFTRWPEAVPIPDTIADTVACVLSTGWISRFCCPQTITTDQ
jgi:hypothetical protein